MFSHNIIKQKSTLLMYRVDALIDLVNNNLKGKKFSTRTKIEVNLISRTINFDMFHEIFLRE